MLGCFDTNRSVDDTVNRKQQPVDHSMSNRPEPRREGEESCSPGDAWKSLFLPGELDMNDAPGDPPVRLERSRIPGESTRRPAESQDRSATDTKVDALEAMVKALEAKLAAMPTAPAAASESNGGQRGADHDGGDGGGGNDSRVTELLKEQSRMQKTIVDLQEGYEQMLLDNEEAAEEMDVSGKPIDRLYEKADESYFFRVQAMVLYNGYTVSLAASLRTTF